MVNFGGDTRINRNQHFFLTLKFQHVISTLKVTFLFDAIGYLF